MNIKLELLNIGENLINKLYGIKKINLINIYKLYNKLIGIS